MAQLNVLRKEFKKIGKLNNQYIIKFTIPIQLIFEKQRTIFTQVIHYLIIGATFWDGFVAKGDEYARFV